MYEWRIVITHEVGNSTHHSDIQWEYNDSGFAHVVLVKNQNCTPQFCGAPLGGCPDCPWSCCGGEKAGTDRRVRVCILNCFLSNVAVNQVILRSFEFLHIHFLNFYRCFHFTFRFFSQPTTLWLQDTSRRVADPSRTHWRQFQRWAVGKFGQWGKLTGFGGVD